MVSERVDLTTLDLAFPELLQSLSLEVGILQDLEHFAELYAMVFKRLTSWRLYPFETYAHATEIIENQSLHIFITHWHLGNDHRSDNRVTQLVDRLRSARGKPGIGGGPLLVATYAHRDGYFLPNGLFFGGGQSKNGPGMNLEAFLHSKYDLILPLPLHPSEAILKISSTLYQQLPVHISRLEAGSNTG